MAAILIKQKIRFEGGDAEQHKVDAYSAAQSLEGLVWALTLATHFGVSGKVRNKGNLSSSVQIYISPPKRGSVLYELNLLVQENPFLALMAGGYAVNTVTPYINSIIGYTFHATASGVRKVPYGMKRIFGKLDEDDVDKLIVRIEPPLTRAHAAIGKSVESISVTGPRKPLVTLDPKTKAYLETRAREEYQTLDTNITSFNVLTGNGRLYHPELKQTVPFSLNSNAAVGVGEVLTQSMNQYAMGRRGMVRITAQRVENIEGNVKQLLVSAVGEIPAVDWDDGSDPLRSVRT